MNTHPETPAFPYESPKDKDGSYMWSSGLTKREYFAGLAMQGILSAGAGYNLGKSNDGAAKHAVDMADALLKELSKK